MSFHGLPIYKIVLVGDAAVGKTAFINRHLTGEFREEYVPTMDVEVTEQLHFDTDRRGGILFNVWDIPSARSADAAEYLNNADAAIIVFDLARNATHDKAIEWHRNLTLNASNCSIIILCGNKMDLDGQNHETKAREPPSIIAQQTCGNAQYYAISTKFGHNIEAPFLRLCQHFLADPSLKFASHCGLPMAGDRDTEIDWECAAKSPLPDEDD
ncbi:hypothetical protein FQN55_006980 [Onygenales sp. PD_40]|nr:hypothetical protein FQN55_006980 [Onygenales sp. PD_40]